MDVFTRKRSCVRKMCSVKVNKDLIYRRIQQLSYELDLMYENPEENQQAIYDFENKKAKLEVKLENAPD